MKIRFWNVLLIIITGVAFQGGARSSDKKAVSEQKTQEIPSEVHKLCLEAKDYAGCVQAQLVGIPKDDGKRRWERDDGDVVVFDPLSVKAIMVNEKFGRYMEYRYVLRGISAGSPGFSTPGVQMPSIARTNVYGSTAYTTITPGATVGAVSIPGRPGGAFSSNWRVEVDCIDYTANWDGDSESWRKLRNIQPDDKPSSREARKIMDEFCPQMPRLVEEALKKQN
jgi:hypothetical protein